MRRIFVFIFFILAIFPRLALATGELRLSPSDYNLDHAVKPGEIWAINNLLVVNLAQRDLSLDLAVYASGDQKNKLKIDLDNIKVEMGKAKSIDLVVTMPIDIQAGYYKGQVVVSIPDDQAAKIEGDQSIINLNFVVEEASYAEGLAQRIISEYKQKDSTFYLFTTLFFLWLLFLSYIVGRKIRQKTKLID